MNSKLQEQPKSQIIEKGYINVYSTLNSKEKRQIEFKRRFKLENPAWDETLVYLAKKFSELCPKDAVILDAGCGNGNYVIDENRQKIAWATGVDVSADFTSKNVCLDEILIASLENLPFESNKFDAVISLWVLEHLENPEKVFGQIHRVLKPNGIFMFATPNSSYLPLKIMHSIKSSRFNHFLNKHLFGRQEADVFPAYYKANSLDEIRTLAKDLFTVKELRLNPDASYTSFNNVTYWITQLILKLPSGLDKYTNPHIMGIMHKN